MIPPLDLIALRKNETVWLGSAENLKHALGDSPEPRAGPVHRYSHETEHKNYYEVTAAGEVKLLDAAAERSK